jgi:hypothetical protein
MGEAPKNGDKAPRKPQQRGLKPPWRKGQSGNPAGCAKGSRHKVTIALENLFDREGETLSRRCIQLAKDGDLQALKLCLDRVLPPRKDRPVKFKLPVLETPEDARTAVSAIAQGVADGEITPAEAAELAKLVDVFSRTNETVNFEERLARLTSCRGSRLVTWLVTWPVLSWRAEPRSQSWSHQRC